MIPRHRYRSLRLKGSLVYALIIVGMIAIMGVGGGQGEDAVAPHPLSLVRWLVPLYNRAAARVPRAFERFFASPSPGGNLQSPPTPTPTPMADAMLRSERSLRRRPRSRRLSPPGYPAPTASIDASHLADQAATAEFEDDVAPAEDAMDDTEGAIQGVEEGAVRFSRLLEFRTREDLFLACSLRSVKSREVA
jgi:hypothetical protein